jgi:hypothetical protein
VERIGEGNQVSLSVDGQTTAGNIVPLPVEGQTKVTVEARLGVPAR